MQFYKQQGVGHYFNLNVRAPSAVVPRWVGERIDAIWGNTGSDNGLLPDVAKPSPEPMLTYR